MDALEENIRNVCGHTTRYRLIMNEDNIEIESKYEDDCYICREESANYRKHVEKRIITCFGD